MSSSVLGEIDDILRDGDIEMLRRDVDKLIEESTEKCLATLNTKADLYHVEHLNTRLDYIEEKQKRTLNEFRLAYERLSIITRYMRDAAEALSREIPTAATTLNNFAMIMDSLSREYHADALWQERQTH